MTDYLNWLKNDYRPALEKAGVPRFRVSRPIFGTSAGEIVTERMLKNLAEIDAGAVLSKVLTEEEVRALVVKAVPLVSSSNTIIVRMRRPKLFSGLVNLDGRSEVISALLKWPVRQFDRSTLRRTIALDRAEARGWPIDYAANNR